MLFLWLVLLQLVIFAMLVGFLRVILARNIVTATSHLDEVNKDYNQKLDEAKKRLQESDRYYDEAVLKAKNDAEKLKAQLIQEAHQDENAIVSEARKQGEEIIQQANKAADAFLKEMDDKVQQESVGKACELIEEVLPSEITKEIHHQWLEELFKNGFSDLARLNVPQNIKEVKVVSAHSLSTDEKSLLQKKLKDSLKRELRLSESVDPLLIAGLKMTLGGVEIDGSLRFKIREATRHAKHPS